MANKKKGKKPKSEGFTSTSDSISNHHYVLLHGPLQREDDDRLGIGSLIFQLQSSYVSLLPMNPKPPQAHGTFLRTRAASKSHRFLGEIAFSLGKFCCTK